MKKVELREVLTLVKEKLNRDSEAACGVWYSDNSEPTTIAVGEEDITTEYAVGEEDITSMYALGEED